MFRIIKGLVDVNAKNLKKLEKQVKRVNALEEKVEKLSDTQLRSRTKKWQKELSSLDPKVQTQKLDLILPEAFAIVREAAKRTVGERTWDEQIMGAIAMHRGMAAELKTGEGKTLTAVHALYLNALTGKGAHLVTVNDYLAKIQAEGMALILNFLGLSVGCINQQGKSYLIDSSQKHAKKYTHYSQADGSNLIEVPRRKAYEADITYGTNNEFGFDYLRDNLVRDNSQIVQSNALGEVGAHHFVIVDEIDSILIDEARTPLIISSQAEDASSRYLQVASLIKKLVKDTDYEVDEKHKSATLTELGIRKLERMLNTDHLYERDFQLVHLVEQSLKAHTLFAKNKDYIVKDGQVTIVDEFTGRLMPGRRYSDGLHQAIEAKEGVQIQKESKTVATISFQNYFRMYEKLSGMSGTVVTEVEEFRKIYDLESVAIPTHEPIIRKDRSDFVYKTEAGKWRAVVRDIKERSGKGQPVLVGTTSVEKNELLHAYLKKIKVPHQILNAKQHESEGKIIAEAGRAGTVTVATNMAGRGVDIILGGTKPMDVSLLPQWKEEHEKVLELGGLYVIGTDRHESRRIDNQLRGRSGRHGEPGESRFYVSLQDDLMRIFGGAAVERIMNRMGLDENTPIEAKLVSRSIETAQKRVEGYNFDVRKHLVEYDDVMDQQRKIIYRLRGRLLENDLEWVHRKLLDLGVKREILDEKKKQVGDKVWGMILRQSALPVVDTLWMEHLTTMDDMREGVSLQAYGQKDPLVMYRQEGRVLFERLVGQIWATIAGRLERIDIEVKEKRSVDEVPQTLGNLKLKHQVSDLGVADEAAALKTAGPASPLAGLTEGRGRKTKQKPQTVVKGKKVGRNDPCPCGSGKKYKKCCGR